MRKLKDNPIAVLALLIIGYLEGAALCLGVNGIGLAAAIGAVAAVSGYVYGRGGKPYVDK